MRKIVNLCGHFIEQHFFLTKLIIIVDLIVCILFVLSNQEEIIMAFSLINGISAVTTMVRLSIWKKGNYLLTTSDVLWRILVLKKKEDRYREFSFKHAKYAFFITCVGSIAECIIFITILL